MSVVLVLVIFAMAIAALRFDSHNHVTENNNGIFIIGGEPARYFE